MTTPTPPLSPAAQSVSDAAHDAWVTEDHASSIAAAALISAADRMMSLIGDACHPKYMEGIEASSDFLEQIAAELRQEGQA
jgi:uncharacterized protein YfiM (DUF2279 family)